MNWTYLLTSFDGRIDRRMFWTGTAVIVAVQLVAVIMAGVTASDWVNNAVDLLLYFPQFAIGVKRGHDRNYPAWMIGVVFAASLVCQVLVLLGWLKTDPDQNVFSPANVVSYAAVMVVGIPALALLIDLGFRKGTPGPNPYGPDPLEPQALAPGR